MLSTNQNIGAYLNRVLADTAQTNVTAGAGNNASALTGVAVDLIANGGPKSCSIAFPIKTTLASGNTLSLAAYLETSASTNGTWVNVAVQPAAVVSTGVSGGGAQYVVPNFDVDLSGALQYVKVV